MYTLGRGSRRSINIWPGFVDALATLLLVVIFVLMVFMIAQYFLSVALTGRDQALTRLEREINDLAELLSLERSANAELRIDVSQLSSELQSSLGVRESLANQLAALTESRDDIQARLAAAEASGAKVSPERRSVFKRWLRTCNCSLTRRLGTEMLTPSGRNVSCNRRTNSSKWG